MAVANKNPFFDDLDDKEIDDDTFLNHPRAGSSGFMLPQRNQGGASSVSASGGLTSDEERLRQIMLKKKEIETSTVESSNRSLGLLYESEKVGAATGAELHRQKEQLLRTEGRLDEINNTLKQSERHLTGIKSVFGGIKNYLFAKNSGLPPATAHQASTSQNMPHSKSEESIGSVSQSDFLPVAKFYQKS